MDFYNSIQEDSQTSAKEISPLVLKFIQPKSIVDVGCGVGTWLSVFKEFGIKDCLGIDGDHIDKKKLQIPLEDFLLFNFKKPLKIDKQFDLVMSLEFAQYLPSEYAETFIDSITKLGSVILFSAAIPSQGGTGHLNEQWPSYWVQHFQRNKYLVIDCLRKEIWNKKNVAPWYAQNILIFVQQDSIEKYPLLKRELENTNASQLALVHPKIYLSSFSLAERAEIKNINLDFLISLIPQNIIERCQQGSSDQASVVAIVRQLRKQIAEFWLCTPGEQLEKTYLSNVGKIHQMLLNSGIKGEPLTDIEQNFVHELAANISRGFDDSRAIQYLLAAMLYRSAYQLPLKYEFASIPQWFLVDYLQFIIYSPDYFQEIGEVDIYYRHLQQLTNYIHTNISNSQNQEYWRYIASFFTQNIVFTFAYCSSKNMKDILTKRSEIIEFVLRTNNYQIDYVFSELPTNREKIRLGVFLENFNPHPEAYNILPVFEYLDRDKFEIILYAIDVNGHPLEQYCQSRADQLVKLPKDLHSQVQTIRADDLDILLIGTILNDITTEKTLLALHRLARIQTTYFVAAATTGMRNVDYFISGSFIEPLQSAQEQYREQLIVLDGPGFCFNFAVEPDAPTIKPDRRNIGVVSDESVVFVSGASPYKIIPELRETWAKIIAAVPNSILVLYPSHSDQYLHSKMSAIFAKYGIEKNRLVILKIKGRSNVKECLKLCDVYLHSYPYSGAASIVEALEVGLPTVVMDGNTLRARVGAAFLQELQIPDLIANTEESYMQLAIALGTNPELRKQKSNQIKQKMQCNPRFMDSRSYSAQIGALFQALCKQQLNS